MRLQELVEELLRRRWAATKAADGERLKAAQPVFALTAEYLKQFLLGQPS
jgi:hypothetical protein